MDSVRKPIGLIILVFLGIPALFHVTWFVGITRAVSQPDFLPDLPIRLSEELPETMEVLFEAARHPLAIEDENARAWIRAAAMARTSPEELLEEIGLLTWLREDLSGALREIFLVLQGRIRPDTITLDLRPLKRAFNHEAIDRYFYEMVENLPPCDAEQEAVWDYMTGGRKLRGRRGSKGLPACRPDQDKLARFARMLKNREADMPDRVILFECDRFKALGLNLFALAFMFSLLLFLIPAAIIAAGAFIAEPMNLKFFRWCGIPVFIAGMGTVFTALLPKLILLILSWLVVWTGVLQYDPAYLPSGLDEAIMERISTLLLTVIDPLLSPVMTTALIVSLLGLALFGLSLFSSKRAPAHLPPPVPRD